jgi:transcriptional regulator of arginine metabolism
VRSEEISGLGEKPGKASCQEASKSALHTYSPPLYIYASAAADLRAALSICPDESTAVMKQLRQDAIRDLVASSLVSNQDELRRKLRRRGIEVTQATLSRDIHELKISKGPSGYALPNGNGTAAAVEDDGPPGLVEVLESFGLRARQAMNQVVIRTVLGGAQPVAAALDNEEWPQVLGTIAGDDTVLIICEDARHAEEVDARLKAMLES